MLFKENNQRRDGDMGQCDVDVLFPLETFISLLITINIAKCLVPYTTAICQRLPKFSSLSIRSRT